MQKISEEIKNLIAEIHKAADALKAINGESDKLPDHADLKTMVICRAILAHGEMPSDILDKLTEVNVLVVDIMLEMLKKAGADSKNAELLIRTLQIDLISNLSELLDGHYETNTEN